MRTLLRKYELMGLARLFSQIFHPDPFYSHFFLFQSAGRLAAMLLLLACLNGCVHMEPKLKYLNPLNLPKPNGYSHVVEVSGGKTIYVSGQVALDKNGVLIGKGDLGIQTQQVFENLRTALKDSGATLDDVVKITVFMTDVSGLQTFREVRDSYFATHHPASSLVQISRLVHPDLLIEIEAIAVVGSKE